MLTAEQIRSTERAASIQSIMAPVNGHLAALSEFLEEQVATFETELQAMVHYCLSNQGKRIRPMLMFFSAWEEEPSEPNPDLIRAAAVVELVHLATLVHDDILDAAAIRHNSETASAKWGADAAVLLGDALFAQALHLATDFSTVTVCRAVSASTRRVCAGEIRQTFERGNSSLSLDDYFHVIDLKTAELFKVSCFLGAHLVGPSAGELIHEVVMAMKKAFDKNDITIPFPIRTLDFGIKGGEKLNEVMPQTLSNGEGQA